MYQRIDFTFLKEICENFYFSIYIPIYVYQKDHLLFCYPEQTSLTYPPAKFRESLYKKDFPVTFINTDFYSYYGKVTVQNLPDTSLIIGPVTNIPYTKDIWHTLIDNYKEQNKENLRTNESFQNFFHNIANQSRDDFLHTLLFLNNCVNQKSIKLEELETSSSDHLHTMIHEQLVRQLDDESNSQYNNNNYMVEMELSHIIETGSTDELERFVECSKNIRVGIIANDNIRQIKNTFIFNISLAMHAAIRGGLSPDFVYQLGTVYCTEMEKLQNPTAIRRLTIEMQKDYTERVSRSLRIKTEKDLLRYAIDYIRSKTHSHITTSDVADYVGCSRSYLSKLFKQELSFCMKDFIVRCKLEESREMLLFSSYSIGEISNILCFSNQSHCCFAHKIQIFFV